MTCSIDVDGTLDAVGTAADPITFTSINDNSVGGVTGSGDPQAADWNGIYGSTTSSIDIEYANIDYGASADYYGGYGASLFGGGSSVVLLNDDIEHAPMGIDLSDGSSSLTEIDSDSFTFDGTAVSISVALTSNAQIENNSFDDNSVAIAASSNWTVATADPVSCLYIPTITATDNTFDGSSTPFVTQTDYALITGGDLASMFDVPTVQDYPPDWTNGVEPSSDDTISVSYEPCIDVNNPLYSYVAIAIPLDLGN